MKNFFLSIFLCLLVLNLSACGDQKPAETVKNTKPQLELLKNNKSPLKDKLIGRIKDSDIPLPMGFELKKSSDCAAERVLTSDSQITLQASSDSFIFVIAKMPYKKGEALQDNSCVLKLVKPIEFKSEIANLKIDFASDRIKKFAQSNIGKAILAKDVSDKIFLNEMLKKRMQEREDQGEQFEVLSPYQLYVTPESQDLQKIVAGLNSYQDILDFVLQKVAWIADKESGGKVASESDYWFTPEELLTITPVLNPGPQVIKSDCSEQANFLVSALIVKGYSPDNMRVVLAEVDFGEGQKGGHAFGEYYDESNQVWVPIDGTMGEYIENGVMKQGIDTIVFDYFLTHEYKVDQLWYAYNNKYFLDFEGKEESNAPANWQKPQATLENVLEGQLGEGE
ncbi:MAG: hypothetical protein UR28_C0029G0011 [Candidatus Peregrinibacteria bacterium GW2011_GWF2_33_10]|nr:MAG: hypothetical protein UR28_C0029G0011 [Candidatus Peregrinibacteria bacterium GW2011_GWF2_33_10]